MNQNSKNLNLTEEIFYQAQSYTIICFVGIVASMTYNIGSEILRALGDSKTSFYFFVCYWRCFIWSHKRNRKYFASNDNKYLWNLYL